MLSHMWLMLLPLSGQLIQPSPARDDSVEAIVQNLVTHEQLYRNIEVRWRRDYRMDPTAINEPVEGLCLRRTVLVHVVRQSEWFRERHEETDTDHLNQIRPTKLLLRSFDGARTIEIAPPLVNIHQGRWDACSYFIPHCSFSVREMLDSCTPLSTWLQKAKVLETRQGKRGLYDYHSLTYEGEREVAGLRTVVIRCDTGPNAKDFRRLRFYLVPDKNYLPALVESGDGDKPVTRRSIVNSWLEVAPAVWLPRSATLHYFNKPGEDGKIGKLYAIDEKELLDAKLNPNYPVEFFRDVQLPTNATVYEIVDGTVVNSHKLTPFTRLDGVPDAWRSFWRWLAVGLAAGAAVLAFLWFRSRRMRSVSAGAA